LLKRKNENLRGIGYRERYTRLKDVAAIVRSSWVKVAETAWTAANKLAFFERIAAAKGEGVVFKKVDALSIADRPATGGSHVKHKFYAIWSFIVLSRNGQRSVVIGVKTRTTR
jgi:bifunctional non-homologous end joining protein LigD